MHSSIETMLSKYNMVTVEDTLNALREVIQEIALLGLYEGGFFKRASFYGGTALQILYGLDRFSEDMDFSLDLPDLSFDLGDYSEALMKTLDAYGFSVDIQLKTNTPDKAIKSAFLKTGTIEELLLVSLKGMDLKQYDPNRQIRIKIEVDSNPPGDSDTEFVFVTNPYPFEVRTYSLSCLFAGKMHAVLCRRWKKRVKGRDWYDMLWYIQRNEWVNLKHLKARMVQSGHWQKEDDLNRDTFLELLHQKIDEFDIASAQEDMAKFIDEPRKIVHWKKELFHQMAERIRTQ